jgi:hypothetical protein
MDPKAVTVWGTYKDDSRKVVNLTASQITFNKNTVGPQTVRIRVSSQEAGFQTEVKALLSVAIGSQPSTVLYKQGQEAERGWPGLEVQGEWDGMGGQRIPTASCEITGYDKDRTGRQNITVSYLGKTASFGVEVRAMASMQIASPPTKVDYLPGETLSLAGLVVNGTWEGFPAEQLNIVAGDVTGFNANNPGVQRLTISKNGRTATLDVDVWRLTGIILDSPPNKTDYAVGEQLVLTGIVVNANYAGSTAAKRRTEAVPLGQLSATGFNSGAVVRNQRVTVTASGQSANFFVNITEAPAVVVAPPAAAATTPAASQPTPGLAYSLINNGAGYDVARGWATGDIVIASVYEGKPVTEIRRIAFQSRTDITSVTIPNSVTTIRYSAFEDCTSLKSITIPNSVTTIENSAFSGCTGLTSITIPNGLRIITDVTFNECTGLTSITIPGSVTSIGNGAFQNCTGLTSVTISNGTTVIGGGAFGGCTSLRSVTIPGSVTSIGDTAFYGTSLASITIPGSVTRIDNRAFDGCTGLTSVTFAAGSSISSSNFGNRAFPQGNGAGDNLRTAYLAGGAGTYTKVVGGSDWTKR